MSFEYKNWIKHDEKPMMYHYKPIISEMTCLYHIRNENFVLFHKIMLLLKNPEHINFITHAQFSINGQNFPKNLIFEIKLKRFKKMTDYCYELEFIVEKTTNVQLMIPTFCMLNHSYEIKIFLNKEKCVEKYLELFPEIILQNYIIDFAIRKNIYHSLWKINTTRGQLFFLNGIMCINEKTYDTIYQEIYDNIHNEIYNEYMKKLYGRMPLKIIINYLEYIDMFMSHKNDNINYEKTLIDEIVNKLSIDWHITKMNTLDGYVLYIDNALKDDNCIH